MSGRGLANAQKSLRAPVTGIYAFLGIFDDLGFHGTVLNRSVKMRILQRFLVKNVPRPVESSRHRSCSRTDNDCADLSRLRPLYNSRIECP